MHIAEFAILQVSTSDGGGGAEKVAWNLFRAYQQHGLPSWLAVGYKRSHDPDVLLMPNQDSGNLWARFWWLAHAKVKSLIGRLRGAGRLSKWLSRLAEPQSILDWWRGIENFNFPGSWGLLELLPQRPNVVHCHNLHGGYFDLRALPWLSQQVPTILTLHDAWLLSGHCAHSFDCQRWKVGCGQCPDLSIYPAIKRDATAYNWRRKQDIYARSRLYVATPSHWLMRKVEQSILAPAIVEARVIPNGVDLTVFHSGNQREARTALGIPQDVKMLLFVGHATRSSPWKDYATLEKAVEQVAERLPDERIILVCLGEQRKSERIGRAEVRFIGYQAQATTVACYYQAADLYVHAAKADTFPNTVLEALACGTPVVATAVGGIPEQVKPLRIADSGLRNSDLKGYGMDEATGMLVPPGNAAEMAEAITTLLTDDALRRRLGHNAAEDVQRRFDLNRQVDDYTGWYREILENWEHR